MIFLDTHLVVWLYGGLIEKIPFGVREKIEAEDLYISPMVLLELQFLFEINRIKVPAIEIYDDLHFRINLKTEDASWGYIVKQSLEINYTRDPFDRLIISHAAALDSTLLTKDQNILTNYPKAYWD